MSFGKPWTNTRSIIGVAWGIEGNTGNWLKMKTTRSYTGFGAESHRGNGSATQKKRG